MLNENCAYFKEMLSLVPYIHNEKVCSLLVPRGPIEIEDFKPYKCNKENCEKSNVIFLGMGKLLEKEVQR